MFEVFKFTNFEHDLCVGAFVYCAETKGLAQATMVWCHKHQRKEKKRRRRRKRKSQHDEHVISKAHTHTLTLSETVGCQRSEKRSNHTRG